VRENGNPEERIVSERVFYGFVQYLSEFGPTLRLTGYRVPSLQGYDYHPLQVTYIILEPARRIQQKIIRYVLAGWEVEYPQWWYSENGGAKWRVIDENIARLLLTKVGESV
jgi:hypothetical protein